MAVRKQRPPTPRLAREMARAVALRQRDLDQRRAAARPPPSDPTGEHTAAIAELARAAGRNFEELLDLWAEWTAVRVYDGQDLRNAEHAAVEDVRGLVTSAAGTAAVASSR